MKCPNCKNQELSQKIKIGGIEIDMCPSCQGLWFEEDELRKTKDIKVADAKWFDFDLWKEQSGFKISKTDKKCPICNEFVYVINYNDSDIEIDVCKKCHGIWLDKGEFKKIISYVKGRSSYEVLNNYAKNMIEEAKEIVTGPESFSSELTDFLIILNLFNYRFMVKHPILTQIFFNVPFTK